MTTRTADGRFAPAPATVEPGPVRTRLKAILRDRRGVIADGPRCLTDLAFIIGWPDVTLRSRLGGTRPLTREHVDALARALGVAPGELLEDRP